MMVFTLPSYPYVFKVIKDVFGSSKEVDHETVKTQVSAGQAGRSRRAHGRYP
jgi:isocitrate dehydrogenase kinase/phosphatase